MSPEGPTTACPGRDPADSAHGSTRAPAYHSPARGWYQPSRHRGRCQPTARSRTVAGAAAGPHPWQMRPDTGEARFAEDPGQGTPVGRRVVLGLLGLAGVGVVLGSRVGSALATISERDPTGITGLIPGNGRFRYYSVVSSVDETPAAQYQLTVEGLGDRSGNAHVRGPRRAAPDDDHQGRPVRHRVARPGRDMVRGPALRSAAPTWTRRPPPVPCCSAPPTAPTPSP